MTRTNTVLCDYCGRDITTTGNCEGWRISVRNERIPSADGPVTAMALYPHLSGNLDFCTHKCLKQFFAS